MLPCVIVVVLVAAFCLVLFCLHQTTLRRTRLLRGTPLRALTSHRQLAQPNPSKTMVHLRHSSLDHLLENDVPPAALFAILANMWVFGGVEDKAFAEGRSSCAAVDLDVGDLAKTSRATFKLLRSLVWRHPEGLYRLALLSINGERMVVVLHSIFYMEASEYEDGPGDLWAVKGDIPSEGLPTLIKLLPLHFACNTAFRGTIRDDLRCTLPPSPPATSATSTPPLTRFPNRKMTVHTPSAPRESSSSPPPSTASSWSWGWTVSTPPYPRLPAATLVCCFFPPPGTVTPP